MNNKKQDVENAILFFAQIYGQEENYKYLIDDASATLPKLVQMITYDMFIQKFCYFRCPVDQYVQYKILLNYAIELKEKGFVEFLK